MENTMPDDNAAAGENSSGLRKRVGRPPKLLHTQTTESTDSAEGYELEELETMEGSASPTNLCRRSTRKKIVKFDVLDVLNKSRKTHKIQIEARIDSNVPTTTTTTAGGGVAAAAAAMAGTSSANRFLVTRPLLPTVPPFSAIKLFTKPKPMPSLIVAQVSSDKATVVRQEEEQSQFARRRGRPRKNQSEEEVPDSSSSSDVDSNVNLNREEDISNSNWVSSDSDESSKGFPAPLAVEESNTESTFSVLQESSNRDSLDSQPNRSITTTPTCEPQQQQQVEEPNALLDIAKFIEDGVKLLERDYKLEDEQQQQQQQEPTEDELAQRVANLETPAATPTPSPAVSTKMEKSEFRVLIKHYFLRKKSITETKERLDKYYGDSAPSISMVKRWFTEFRCGRTSTSDAERSGRPKKVVMPEIVDKIHGMILDDRRMKVREVAEAVGISTERDKRKKRKLSEEAKPEAEEKLLSPAHVIINTHDEVVQHLKALQEYAMLNENFRATGLLLEAEKAFTNPPDSNDFEL